MQGTRWYSIDLSLAEIVDKMARGEMICKSGSVITESDIKAFSDSVKFGYPLPHLVLFRVADGRYQVVTGEKLVRTLVKFIGAEENKRLISKYGCVAVHGVLVESSNPSDRENIGKFFRGFSV